MRVLILLLIIFSHTAFSQIFTESFSYPENSHLDAFGWKEHSGGGFNPIQIAKGTSFNAVSFGNVASLSGSGQDVHQSFSPIDRGSVYVSFLVNVSEASSEGEYFLHLGPEELGTNFRGRVFVKNNGDHIQFGISKSSNNPVYADQKFEVNKTYQLILKYTFLSTSGKDDLVDLFILVQATETEPASYTRANSDENDAPNIGSVALRQGSSSKAASVTIDEIKVATNWEDASSLEKKESVEIQLANSLYGFKGSCEKTSVFEGLITGYSKQKEINLWTLDGDHIRFSKDKINWSNQISFTGNNNQYFSNFYVQIDGADISSENETIEIVIDDAEANELYRLPVYIKYFSLRNDCSLPIAYTKELFMGDSVKVAGVISASAREFGDFNYLQDQTSGIRFQGDYGFQVGDSVSFYGILTQVYDEPMLHWDSLHTNLLFGQTSIEPKSIDLTDLENYKGELVKLEEADMNDDDFVYLPNTNETFRQNGRSGTMRIWSSTSIDGHQKPEDDFALTGVVGQFRDQLQIYPRRSSDISEIGTIPTDQLNISKEYTFDLATWNLEWFGSPGNGPEDDDLQLQNALKTMQRIDADVYILEEITDLTQFSSLVSQLGDYSGTCSNAVSGGGDPALAQRVCIVYKNETVNLSEVKTLLSRTPVIADYPDTFERFWASGRYPALFTVDVNIDNVKRRLHILGIHARANRSGDEKDLVYEMRKKDIEVLKDSLDQYYPNNAIIMAGDYNDDVDETVVSGLSLSTYAPFTSDSQNWKVLTKDLSEKGHKTYIGYDNVIDHITISNELFADVIEDGTQIQLPFVTIDNYPSTTSDHLPVLSRFMLNDVLTASEETDSLVVFPNPTTGQLSILMPENEKVEVELLNALGKTLLSTSGTKNDIERKLSKKLERQPVGQYLLKLFIGNTVKTYKLVRQ
ncbi:DUF5689 domain-containing protein [Jiulongibacter sp. NS-SX5]|uniref:DUF5689 domain-containing protein n=1 Tax=Jiulongibacter sp. NS-SX5 TaxID=3463854 RepID=UPI0040594E68